MASIALPLSTMNERANFGGSNRDAETVDTITFAKNYHRLRISGGLTVVEVGFRRTDEPSLFLRLGGFSGEAYDALYHHLPRGYELFRDADGNAVIVRQCADGHRMIPRNAIPLDELDDWDHARSNSRPNAYCYTTYHWGDIAIFIEGTDPDVLVDERFLTMVPGVEISRSIGTSCTPQALRSLERTIRFTEFEYVKADALKTEVDEPGRVWLSTMLQVLGGAFPNVRVPYHTNSLSLARTVTKGRMGWACLSGSSGKALDKMFTPASPQQVKVTKGVRALEIRDERAIYPERWQAEDLTPASDTTLFEAPRWPVLGVKPGATGFTRYSPNRVWPTISDAFERNAFTWGGDRVFIHRGYDMWRFIFAFEESGHSSHSSDGVMLLYCIAVTVAHKEVADLGEKTFRGMPLDLQQAIWAVPGMSLALTHALNRVRYQLTLRKPLRPYTEEKLPKDHFITTLGAQQTTRGYIYRIKNLFDQDGISGFSERRARSPFQVSNSQLVSIGEVVTHLFRLAGPSLLQPVAQGETITAGYGETAKAPALARCLDL